MLLSVNSSSASSSLELADMKKSSSLISNASSSLPVSVTNQQNLFYILKTWDLFLKPIFVIADRTSVPVGGKTEPSDQSDKKDKFN